MAINKGLSIASVSKKFEISADTLRYYERIGLIPTVTRNSSGIRNYSDKDQEWVEFIKCMRSAGISIEALIEYVGMVKDGNKTILARKALLIEERDKLSDKIDEMQATLDRLDKKIDGYESRMVVIEDNFKK